MVGPTEFAKFDAVVRKMMSVSHDEIVRREAQWKKDRLRAKKKRASKTAGKAKDGA